MIILKKEIVKEWGDVAKYCVKSYFTSRNSNDEKMLIADYYRKEFNAYFSDEGVKRLKERKGLSEQEINARAEVFNEAFWKSHQWWQRENEKNELVILKYRELFKKAEKIAEEVDVSDIQDGFPCGSCDLYLSIEARKTDLGKTLKSMSGNDTYTTKVVPWSTYQLPVKIPSYGQCVSFDERICGKVAEFLNENDVPTSVHTWID